MTDLKLLQNGVELEPSRGKEGRWKLRHLSSQIVIEGDGTGEVARRSIDLRLTPEFWVFKLDSSLRKGRAVKGTTKGWYLAVVPSSWSRDEAVAGPPPVEPEAVFLEGYRAHYFDLTQKDSKQITFSTPHRRRTYPAYKLEIELGGNRIADAEQRVGPLFGETPPTFQTRQDWNEVRRAIVGREGSPVPGIRRTRVSLLVDPSQSTLVIPPKKLTEDGWYFARFYDGHDDLVDSLDFRYAPGLRGVEVSDQSPLPPSLAGFPPLTVTIRCHPGSSVKLDEGFTSQVSVEKDICAVRIRIPPEVRDDVIKAKFFSNGAEGVRLAIGINRIWWAVSPETDKPACWEDRPIRVGRREFDALSGAALWLRLPRPCSLQRVWCGFVWTTARRWKVPRDAQMLRIPLRDFGDAEELRTMRAPVPLYLWIDPHGKTGAIALQVVPTFVCRVDSCGYTTTSEDDATRHVCERHSSVVPELRYDEIVMERPELNLPGKIYKCSYCTHYEKSEERRGDPTGNMSWHLKTFHPGLPASFRVVDNVDEIRRHVIATLPTIYTCRWAAALPFAQRGRHRFDTEEAALRHVLKDHWNELFQIS